MAFDSKLQKTFYEDLKRLSLFEEAVKLVKETYKLEVEVNKSKTEFVIKADGSELLEFVQTLLESWLEGKKKKQSDKFEDRIKVTKENPLSDIFDGHVVWVFWGDLATKLSSDIYKKEVEKLKLVQESCVSLKYEKSGRLIITCTFKTFKDIKSKVESLKLLAVSGKHDIGKVKTDSSKSHVSKDNGSGDSENGDMKEKDHNGTSEFRMTTGIANQDKLVKSETSTDNGEDLKQNLLPDLRGSNHASDQSPHGTGSEEKGVDDKLLFCSPSGKIKVFVYEASITRLSGIDAIVSAANEDLKHIGGVAYNISKAAGGDKSSLEKECFDYIKQVKKVDVAKNFTSSAGNMPYKGVIHAVGPMWSDYKAKEDCAKDLCMTIMNVLVEADNKMFSKIALPAISSGICGVPMRLCAEMYIKGVIDYDSKSFQTLMREIHFVDIDKDILQEIRDAYRRWQQDDSCLDFKNANSYSSTSDCSRKDLPLHKPGDGVDWLRKEIKESTAHSQRESQEADNCPLCMHTLYNPKKLLCGHEFHAECIDQSLECRQICSVCGTLVEHFTGNQPTGIMYHNTRTDSSLPGFEGYNTVEIYYKFPDGIQGENHPHPGRAYKGTFRKAFLPDNPEGRKVLQLLKVAFERKLIFTVGDSLTTGRKDVVTWNGIEHKTKVTGGPSQYGFPDRAYLSRVQGQLTLMGVTEKDIQDAGGVSIERPKHWTDMKSSEILEVVNLHFSDPEYTKVVQEFHTSSGSRRPVVQIERIQNVTLYTQYLAKKRQLDMQNSHSNNERILWHGTTFDAVDSINTHGFNRSYCGKNAASYGKGVYFAVSASYSVKETYSTPDSNGHKKMYQCRVLTGDYTQGKSGMRVPPPKSATQPHILYDSVVDKPNNPNMFVIFHDAQAYPDYLITFK